MNRDNGDDIDRRRALDIVPVSRETEARLGVYVDLLRKWQRVKNLVAPSTLGEVWMRHVADSAQLIGLAPAARTWVDLGSGAGFPGLVIAIELAGRPHSTVHLIESDQGKCAFLREVIRATQAPAIVHAGRIEAVVPALSAVDAVTARALAPLPRLLKYAEILLMRGAVGVFPKGRTVDAELTEPSAKRKFRLDLIPSRTDPHGRIVMVRAAPH